MGSIGIVGILCPGPQEGINATAWQEAHMRDLRFDLLVTPPQRHLALSSYSSSGKQVLDIPEAHAVSSEPAAHPRPNRESTGSFLGVGHVRRVECLTPVDESRERYNSSEATRHGEQNVFV